MIYTISWKNSENDSVLHQWLHLYLAPVIVTFNFLFFNTNNSGLGLVIVNFEFSSSHCNI